ncbi:MAG: zinc ribbon domain-containing protein [Anaerolineae bacterium]|nr:zinc ribbon domain-containing protein [Anaerolineae bacterium]
MPIYEYECLICGSHFEKRQSFSDEPHADCPNGHTKTRRLLAAPTIVFKGSGFYVTDNRSKNGANHSSTDKKSESKSETKSETKLEKKSEASKETA